MLDLKALVLFSADNLPTEVNYPSSEKFTFHDHETLDSCKLKVDRLTGGVSVDVIGIRTLNKLLSFKVALDLIKYASDFYKTY